MRTVLTALAAGTIILGTSAFARADDAKACNDGVAMIKAEIAKKPAQATLDKLNKALKGAQRELGEKEYDECLDFVNDAKKALKS